MRKNIEKAFGSHLLPQCLVPLCATMSVLLKTKKKWLNIDLSGGYETLDWRSEKIDTYASELRFPQNCEEQSP